ncbi:MAG: succinylglutamate desuccinylase/aspartoacylase family protein [Bacteroidales bacterium]|nr:succinylglutamate desuccinylase/aspartoacylase family protein [Bacteroidales bacterium]MDI9574380.1 M14 family zinc carboxypeptidase [Bacteroidota bacterium]MBP9511336.1 succinylglutamate desuccinylase/aspartoacylase family protein [Bacteroidales bacterium]MBP9587859.1 succinylglutamate desuccinylase/aspartoacylase family protein [Bacteroidales bacterium]HOE58767.1 M14 family zinc carboxypeptidase [Bacteroidales bacterium]
MKKLQFFILTVSIFVGLLPYRSIAQGWRSNEMEINVLVKTLEDMELIHRSGWSYDRPSSIPGIARLYLIPKELEELKQMGMEYSISIPDIAEHYRDLWGGVVPPGYYTYEQLIAIEDSLAAAFPAICKKIVIGTSVQNRQLAVLKISDNVEQNEAEPEIFFEAGIHGDEVGGPENLIRFARDLCKGYGSNPQITNLVNTRELFILVMTNPDGRVQMSRYNANLVDINRDGGYMWDGEGNSPGAFSQTETKAIRDFAAQNQFVVFTDYHSGTEFISYPWSYRPQMAPDQPHLHQLAHVYATNSGYTNIPYASGYSGMYPINGSTKDFNYGLQGSISWSIEISNNKQPPASQIYYYYLKNKGAMIAISEQCGKGIYGVVTDSVTGNPIPAKIRIGGTVPLYNDPVVGDYHKFVVPGIYTVEASANGYKTKTITDVQVLPDSSVGVDIALSPKQGHYAFQIKACRIPGNNFYDEGHTWAALGEQDGINYSLGKNGWIILDMYDTIYNGNGNDILVVEGDSSPESYSVYAAITQDGPWKLMGSASGTHEFDLTSANLNKARYLKIVDGGTGSYFGEDAGFDLDGVKVLYIPVSANFTASNTMPCIDNSIDFADNSLGNPTIWQWLFQGGNPSSSNSQNPSGIMYPNPGIYDVTLTVGDGVTSSSLTKSGYIHVYGTPLPPLTPLGDSSFCQGLSQSDYTTAGAPNATSYEWVLTPTDAGIITGNWILATVNWNPNFNGQAMVKARETSPCGTGQWSLPKVVDVMERPIVDLGNDTIIAASASLLLDAGNPGCSYLWNTNETTQTIIADTNGIGAGIHEYWVRVTSPNLCSSSDTILINFSIDIGMPDFSVSSIKVFPNPTTQGLWIELNEEIGMSDIFFIDTKGEKWKLPVSIFHKDTLFYISTKTLPSGIYFLRIEASAKALTIPIIKR